MTASKEQYGERVVLDSALTSVDHLGLPEIKKIDYAKLLINKYRNALVQDKDFKDALANTFLNPDPQQSDLRGSSLFYVHDGLWRQVTYFPEVNGSELMVKTFLDEYGSFELNLLHSGKYYAEIGHVVYSANKNQVTEMRNSLQAVKAIRRSIRSYRGIPF